MKYLNLRTMALTALAASTFLAADVNAQSTQSFTATATVSNAITLANATNLAFGQIIAIPDAADQTTFALATDGTHTVTPGANSYGADLNGADETVASVDVTGVNGQNVNLTITNVVDPTDGSDTLALSAWRVDIDGAGEGPQIVDTPFVLAADGTAQPILIGATISTPLQAGQLTDGVFTGSFDLVASY